MNHMHPLRAQMFCIPLLLLLLLNLVQRSEAASTVSLDKGSYCQGEQIAVSFDGVEGEGIWVGIYKQDDVTDFANLPGWETETLKGWVLTCGERSETGCSEWPTTGTVELETDLLEEDEYVIVISEDRAALSAQAFTDTFLVVSCGEPVPVIEDFPTTLTGSSVIVVVDDGSEGSATIVEAEISEPAGSPGGVMVADSSIIGIIQEARTQILDMIEADDDLIGKFLRLVFHDCVGGCDGCVDMTNPDHGGLAKPIEVLAPIVDLFADQGLTRTDIWMLSALAAIDVALPLDMRDINTDLHWIGRRTCESFGDCGHAFHGGPTVCTEMLGPHREMCHGGSGTATMQKFFEDEFNFTPQQITAIMGAHSIGAMHRENSGHSGKWDLTPTSLDIGYWIELVGQPPNFFIQEVDNSDLPGIPNQRNWLGVLNPGTEVVMLNIDIALVRNVPDIEDGIDCDFETCSRDTPFMTHVNSYLADTRLFLTDFLDVMNVLIDHGHDKNGECPIGQVCSFGFGAAAALIMEAMPVEAPSNPPVALPTFSEPEDGDPTVTVNKSCYNSGDIIVASFENISGSGIVIGIFAADLVTDFRQLPPFDGGDLKESVLSCGNTQCHTWLSSGGAQLSTANLDPGRYVAAISGTDASSEGQAAINFQVGNCD
ncbi:peroxidase [Nitzschia inconspicua]|uniref:Peroxidase n=1 Tax=Nitzschia inconspicua TaxID=303405 RepID=A0A9K3LUL3_9STRA|nr:peroxidase [Nitzschia inconspicua]